VKVPLKEIPLLYIAMCALAIVPLIKRLRLTVPSAQQVQFADDATAVGNSRFCINGGRYYPLWDLTSGIFQMLLRQCVDCEASFFDNCKVDLQVCRLLI